MRQPKPLRGLEVGSPGQQWGGRGPRHWEATALGSNHLLHQPRDHKLSDQREALRHGQNPLPIYCALNTKGKSLTTFEFGGE